MDLNPTTVVEYESPDGEVFILAGPYAGNLGVTLARGEITGWFDLPAKTHIQDIGSIPGARPGGVKFAHRLIVFGVDIVNENGGNTWLRRDSMWRKGWSYTKPGKLRVTTKESGTRTLYVYLYEAPEIPMEIDPSMRAVNICKMSVIAYDPFWYEDPIQFDLETLTNTVSSGTEDLTFVIGPNDGKSGGLNPTDRPIDLTWVLEGTGKYTLPDYSFTDASMATRRITLPELLITDGDLVGTSSKKVEQFSTTNNTPFWARMNGVRLINKVPEYTESKSFVVTATKTPPGRTVSLFLERPWSRPWGLE